ncbi:hypothetical protein DPMN_141097 [Dreissena polymorpha]|uniref:Uncharacterized protein n=1 Tax=Dreissena polymorpha TaxID=45954 RepID=A0A9D4JHZ4_DREPO|nr:hypothetical protein DPMN_141097 [Dreissena polymorpha]
MWGAVSCALSLLVISVDRYRKVCCPLKRQISYSLALKLCGLVTFVISIIVAATFSAFHGILAQNKTNIYRDKKEVYICTITEVYRNHPLTKIFQLDSMEILCGVSVSATMMYILFGRQIYLHWGAFLSKIRSDYGKDSHSGNTTEHSHTLQTPKRSFDNSNHLDVNLELINIGTNRNATKYGDSTFYKKGSVCHCRRPEQNITVAK